MAKLPQRHLPARDVAYASLGLGTRAVNNGGTIEIVTEPGSFTEFIITLPRVMPAHETRGQRK
jgi:hypothetical protein